MPIDYIPYVAELVKEKTEITTNTIQKAEKNRDEFYKKQIYLISLQAKPFESIQEAWNEQYGRLQNLWSNATAWRSIGLDFTKTKCPYCGR